MLGKNRVITHPTKMRVILSEAKDPTFGVKSTHGSKGSNS